MVNSRIDWQKIEAQILAPGAMPSAASRGREQLEPECDLRTCFQRDRDRIIHSKAFRRLKQKTQVFIAPTLDHFRTRLTHTLEVNQISRTMARALSLNEDLTEAIALGHDLGHTPFGHAGERTLRERVPSFSHNKQSLRVVELLEKDGQGLNLTWEVRDGILYHSGQTLPQTLEGQIVHLADRIAYINHDIDDATRAGIIAASDIPAPCNAILGEGHSQRIDTMVKDLIDFSSQNQKIAMSPPVGQAMLDLRAFLFDTVYMRDEAKAEEAKVRQMLLALYDYFVINPGQLPASKIHYDRVEQAVCDYIAGMTDRFAINLYEKTFGEKCQIKYLPD